MKVCSSLVCRSVRALAAIALATVPLVPGAFAATQVLQNPGFETGNATGWTGYGNGAIESTNNTYYNGGQPGGSNVLTHTGDYVAKTWGQFSGTYNINGYYQDAVAAPGSVWSADGWALSHEQDYVQLGISFWLEMTFRDSSDIVLKMVRSHVYETDLEVVSSNVWLHLSLTNEYDIADPFFLTITNTADSFTAPPGTSKVRFQIAFAQVYGYPGGSAYWDDMSLIKVAASDPDITQGPVSQTKVVGQDVTFSVTAAGATTLNYQWQRYGTNLSNTARVSGVNTANLTISSLTLDDAGSYTVVVSDLAGTLTSAPATLTVVPVEQANNLLVNRGFETGMIFPWIRFNGGALATTNNNYYVTPDPVEVYDGLYVAQSYGAGEWNGIYQDAPASPGQVFTGDGWFLLAAQDPLTGQSEAWLEVQFQNAAGNLIGLWKSDYITTNGFPSNTWVNLKATNIIAFWDDYSVVGQTNALVAPPGTAKVRCQVTFHSINGGGSVWYDNMSLFLKNPVTLTTSVSGNTLTLSFPTQLGYQYEVLYKDDLTDASWQVLTTVTGDGNTRTATDTIGATKRFYRVNLL